MEGLYYYHFVESTKILRFYLDQTVLSASLSEILNEFNYVLRWFKKETLNRKFSEGKYKLLDNNQIHFKIRSVDGEISEYTGKIIDDKIKIYYRNGDIETYLHYEKKIDEIYKMIPIKKYPYELLSKSKSIQHYFSNVISYDLIKKLENVFEYFLANIDNPYIISVLQYKEVSHRVFLIAKDPKKDIYYGFTEGISTNDKEIMTYSSVFLTFNKFRELSIEPFLYKPYLEHGKLLKDDINLL
jgi:hypothetical protein